MAAVTQVAHCGDPGIQARAGGHPHPAEYFNITGAREPPHRVVTGVKARCRWVSISPGSRSPHPGPPSPPRGAAARRAAPPLPAVRRSVPAAARQPNWPHRTGAPRGLQTVFLPHDTPELGTRSGTQPSASPQRQPIACHVMRVQAFAALRYVAHLLAARAFAAGAPVRLRRGLSATYLRTTVEAHRVQCGGLMEHDAADPGLFSPAAVDREDRAGGSAALRSRHPLSPCPATVVEVFAARAREHPERVLVAQRDGGGWRVLPWGEAAAQVEAVAPSLLDRGVAGRPVMICPAIRSSICCSPSPRSRWEARPCQ